MNVMLVSPFPPPVGGIATCTLDYIKVMENDVNIFTVNSGVIGKRINDSSKKNMIDEFLRMFRIRKNMKDCVKNNHIDIIHYNSSCSIMGMIKDYLCLNSIKKSNIILQCHCNVPDMAHGRIGKYLLKKICKLTDYILCLNSSSEKYIKKITGKRVKVIPNFIDSDFWLNSKKIYKKSIRDIVFVGNVSEAKGINEIIYISEKKTNINFSIIGKIVDDKLIKKSNNIKYFGVCDKKKIRDELVNCDVLLFPSHTEGFPMAVLEAMAIGVPIIAFNVGAIGDMIESKGGMITNVGNTNDLLEFIDKVADVEVRKKMGDWNINKVKKEYTDDVVKNMLINCYGEVCVSV